MIIHINKKGKLKKFEMNYHDAWNLDMTLATLLIPILTEFKEKYCNSEGLPGDIDKMILAFKLITQEEQMVLGSKGKQEHIQEGLTIFAEKFTALWI